MDGRDELLIIAGTWSSWKASKGTALARNEGGARPVLGVAGQQSQGMGQDRQKGGEVFDRPAGAAGQVDDQGDPTSAGDRPAKSRHRVLRIAWWSINKTRPWASRSITARVASGVTSRGPNPVPPVVTNIETLRPLGQICDGAAR